MFYRAIDRGIRIAGEIALVLTPYVGDRRIYRWASGGSTELLDKAVGGLSIAAKYYGFLVASEIGLILNKL